MSIGSDNQTKTLNRVRALVERGERVPAADIAALFAVTDTNALALIARIPRERRFGRSAFFTDVRRVEYRGESATELFESLGEERLSIALVSVGGVDPQGFTNAARELGRRHHVVIATTAERVERASKVVGAPHTGILGWLREAAPIVVTADGAELLDDGIRSRLAPRAVAAETWLDVHRAAHGMGIPTIAGMTYLTTEQPEAYAAHLDALRALQDETGGFVAFVPAAVHNLDRDASYLATPSAHQSLRAIAIARIALDNIEHICAPPALIGAEVAVVAMSYGADVVDTTVTADSVQLVESEGPVAVDLPVLGEATSSPRALDGELVRSRLVEARFVPEALDATMSRRVDAEVIAR